MLPAIATRYSTIGGLNAVSPFSSEKPAMKVWDSTRLWLRPKVSLESGSVVVWLPTGMGKLRGSITVSDTPLAMKNQSSPFRKPGFLPAASGRSPFSVLWWKGSSFEWHMYARRGNSV